MKKAAIYTPYLDTAGGGEKYMLTIAETLSQSYEVDVLLDKNLLNIDVKNIKDRFEKFHNLDLSNVNFVKAPLYTGQLFKKALFLKKYEILFHLSDGSFFHSTAKKSFLHFQMPLDTLHTNGVLNKFKISSWKEAIYNSEFTKNFIEKKLKIKGRVIYPPVDVDRFKVQKKKNYILNVGRFMGEGTKKQHILIQAFKDLVDKRQIKDYSLHLAGVMDDSDRDYVSNLEKDSKGYPIYIYKNQPFEKITKLYEESKIYWHAMGFEEYEPSKFEHFGISTVEALAAGAVPIVINKGGQTEIVEENKTGFLWNTLEELKEKTIELIKDNQKLSKLSENGRLMVDKFSKQEFSRQIVKLINE